ncbi:transducin family protein / WD-40 repeat family protein [Wolffia australiana]
MMGACVKSVPRSALASFCPDSPFLATGTMAGAVDLSFSSSANLEIFNLDLGSEGPELPIVGACPSGERFHRLSWSRPPSSPSEDYALGLVAGGLVDGSISVWNPRRLISSRSEEIDGALVARLEKHRGPVRGLEFCNLSPNLLASGADEGELCIWDLANPSEPIHYPALKSGAQSEVSFASWNPKFQPILASTSHNGVTVVWDLRQQKPVTSFSDSRRCTVLQWNPDLSTQLIIALDAGTSSSLKLWDVRRAIAPLKEFVGHTDGVIAMSWCPNDSLYLVSCSKDNKTICWDTNNGEIISELPAGTSCNFDVQWCPKIPGLISASSFDVKIGLYNIEASTKLSAGGTAFQAPVKLRAPKWLKRPVGLSFGFGGKLVTFRPTASAAGTPANSSELHIHSLVTESSLVSRSTEFVTAIENGEKASLRVLCDQKYLQSQSEDEKETWSFLKVMFEDDGTARTKLLAHLGFSVAEQAQEAEALSQEVAQKLSLDETAGNIKSFDLDSGESFFNNPQPLDSFPVEAPAVSEIEQKPLETEGLAERAESSFDDSIRHALIIGDYKGAVSQCISAGRMADALVIANMGGPALWESTRDQYLQRSSLSYLKVVSAMVKNDLLAFVNERPLDLWKETLAILCTFAQKEEWTLLCDTLASRLLASGSTFAATLCFICSGNLKKTIEIWSCSLKLEPGGKTYVDLLQDLMEKTVVLFLATGGKEFTTPLAKLVENYVELLASQGLLNIAMDYLRLLGSKGFSQELDILHDRIAASVGVEKLAPKAPAYETAVEQPVYGFEQPSLPTANGSLNYYQPPSVSVPSYAENYNQPLVSPGGGYHQPPQQKPQPSFFTPEPLPAQMFNPPQSQLPHQGNYPPPGPAQPPVKFFVPAPAPALKNVPQFQPHTLGAQLYPQGTGETMYTTALPLEALGQKPPPSVVANPPQRTFTPVTNPGFIPRPVGGHQVQPPSPTLSQPAAPVSSIPASQPTVQTVDTSNVPGELKPVIATLTRLYKETSDAIGGPHANTSKKREIEDNSRKIGSLFAKLNNGDISPNAASKLVQLCQALDVGDYASALHIQVLLTTSDWDECNFWLAALKRMIKTRQSVRLG